MNAADTIARLASLIKLCGTTLRLIRNGAARDGAASKHSELAQELDRISDEVAELAHVDAPLV